jgi:hypothetical protein
MKNMILTYGNQVRVYEKCRHRKGWIIVLQVGVDSWGNEAYDKYR